MIWLTGGALALSLTMIGGLLALVLWFGLRTFWPQDFVRVELHDGRVLMGEVAESERWTPGPEQLAELEGAAAEAARAELAREGDLGRRKLRVDNFDLTGEHFVWISDHAVRLESRPEGGLTLERQTKGRFVGFLEAVLLDGEPVATEPAAAWRVFEERHGEVRARWRELEALRGEELGRVHEREEGARLAVRRAELRQGRESGAAERARAELERVRAEAGEQAARISERIAELERENARHALRMVTADGVEQEVPLAEVMRAVPANRLGFLGKVRVYLARFWEFVSDEPRQANSEGGVFPAIFGTIAMTLIMSLLVVPFGVLAALYLREYAKQGLVVSVVRVAVNNLAGVPSIVFGVFGLGFFCYTVGGWIDESFHPERLPTPFFGKGGLLWASLTLALLTLPVVIVATEEALAAVPSSMREGSLACGATRWQTIRRIVLPRAMPGIMTGMILAIARGAGEVAPLMLVGAVKVAGELPLDLEFPFVHAQRSFMHLGFHIYDLGFQSQNSEAAKPMVYTTTLLLIAIVVLLNVVAVVVRGRLRRRFQGS
jgi:phosphate transport system permease protein